MTRGMTAGMETEAQAKWNQPIFFVRLDIATDPFIKWSGYGPHIPSATGDAAFDGFTFEGMGDIGEISAVRDTDSGSNAVTLELPGVDINDTALKEIVQDQRQWQYRRAWIWAGYLNSSFAVISKPTRFKTGRMDTMELVRNKGTGSIILTVESHQANISQAQAGRYSDQKDLDPTDTGWDYIHDLVNRPGGAGVPTNFVRNRMVDGMGSRDSGRTVAARGRTR